MIDGPSIDRSLTVDQPTLVSRGPPGHVALVAKSLGGTAQAPVLGNRTWDNRFGSELGHQLGPKLGLELRT